MPRAVHSIDTHEHSINRKTEAKVKASTRLLLCLRRNRILQIQNDGVRARARTFVSIHFALTKLKLPLDPQMHNFAYGTYLNAHPMFVFPRRERLCN